MRQLVEIVPAELLGPFREGAFKARLYGPRLGDLVQFVSVKHRITQNSARFIIRTIFDYIGAETLKNNETVGIPRFGNIYRGRNITGPGGRSGPQLLIARNSFVSKLEHFEDPEDAGPRDVDNGGRCGQGGIHPDDEEYE